MIAYRWCPRKYYYQYIKKIKGKPNLAMISGNIVHQTISDFIRKPYALKSALESEHYDALADFIIKIFNRKWWKAEPLFEELPESPADIKKRYLECRRMIRNWFEGFYSFALHEYEKCGNMNIAVLRVKPKSEIPIRSEKYGIYARLDEIREGDKVIITDYKTGKYNRMTDSIRLQLAVCALAYLDRYERMPDKVCADFLAYQGGIEEIDVDYGLLDEAKKAIETHRLLTESTDIRDYPCKCGKCAAEFENGERES